MGASYNIEDCLKHGDIVVIGEGEKTLVELMERLQKNPEDLTEIAGIAYKKNENIFVNKSREFLSEEEITIECIETNMINED